VISKLRELDRSTMLAEGPRFDLEKVLAAGHGILRALIGRAQMRFPDAAPMELVSEEPEGIPATADSLEEIADIFREIKRDRYDAADLHFYAQFGPFLATWAPLGFDALYGSMANCLTSAEANWDALDPTPTLFFMSRDRPLFPMGPKATKFLKEVLGDDDGVVHVDFVPHDADAEIVVVRFFHEAFGAGHGPIRICRYLEGPCDEEDEP